MLPQNMPIVTARIHSGGPAPLRREDVSIEVDGNRVEFVTGPNGRIYALPGKALAEGKHTVTVSVAATEGKTATERKEFEVEYGHEPSKPALGGT